MERTRLVHWLEVSHETCLVSRSGDSVGTRRPRRRKEAKAPQAGGDAVQRFRGPPSASPKGETEVVENILKAREELEKTGSHLKRGKGSAKDAAGDLAKRLERYVKENYWELEERRKTLAGLR